MADVAEFLDVRNLALAMRISTARLVRMLADDRVALVQLSPRIWRIEAAAWDAWVEKRKERTQRLFERKRRVQDFVAGKAPVQPERVEFRR